MKKLSLIVLILSLTATVLIGCDENASVTDTPLSEIPDGLDTRPVQNIENIAEYFGEGFSPVVNAPENALKYSVRQIDYFKSIPNDENYFISAGYPWVLAEPEFYSLTEEDVSPLKNLESSDTDDYTPPDLRVFYGAYVPQGETDVLFVAYSDLTFGDKYYRDLLGVFLKAENREYHTPQLISNGSVRVDDIVAGYKLHWVKGGMHGGKEYVVYAVTAAFRYGEVNYAVTFPIGSEPLATETASFGLLRIAEDTLTDFDAMNVVAEKLAEYFISEFIY